MPKQVSCHISIIDMKLTISSWWYTSVSSSKRPARDRKVLQKIGEVLSSLPLCLLLALVRLSHLDFMDTC